MSVRAIRVLWSISHCCGAFGCTQGKLDEAKPYIEQALAIDKKVYGEEHPDVARDLNNLAGSYQAQASFGPVNFTLNFLVLLSA